MEYFNLIGKHHASHKLQYIYYGAKKECFIGLGFELEIDADGEISKTQFRNACAKILALNENKYRYFLEKDGTLRYGFELITQPHTVEAMKEFVDLLPDIFEELIEAGATDEAKRAGLHIHVSKKMLGETEEEQKDNIAKLICFFANYPVDIEKAGRRKSMKKCKVLPLTTKAEATDYVNNVYESEKIEVDRDVAINIRNNNTFEFRAMQTTLNIDVLKAEIDFILHLVEKSKAMAWKNVRHASQWLKDAPATVKEYLNKCGAFQS